MDLYAENILDHYRSPRGTEPVEKPSVEHQEVNASCGDELTIQLKIEDEKITGLSWKGTGCAISQAAMSMLSEEILNSLSREATAGAQWNQFSILNSFTPKNIYDLLGVPIGPRRFKCALLCLHALKNALRLYEKKEPQSWIETVGVER